MAATPDPAPSVDPRTARTDRKIVAGALRLLREGGPQRVTIEAVSTLTGVAKTSIYRRYDNSTQLLEAALQHTTPVAHVLPEDAGWEQALTAAVDVLLRDMGVGVAITLLQDPNSATSRVLRASVVRPRMNALRAVLQLEQQRGAIRAAVDLDMVIDFILGSAYAHLARYGSLDERWTERVHRALADQIATPGTSSPVTPGRGTWIPGPQAPGTPLAGSPPREDDAARPAQKTSRSSGRSAR
ncbi:TetR family transcriptional regulator [Kocuria tytonicola]|uniref:TetR/AcrR family transcriptional regulator n=1 Tax=Kocuria tytonicola TaxID=2055946 RepID=A0A3L9LYN5_9MICC|nr:TetR/AcrR family transcriptional regulator [Kocuria tytonicola]RLY92162.1 TetR/AcrR family transcriptional regulator [Kocuria tytonicola]RLZ02388.1 TetR family transcriptional regulator [Kocuria tytonicola]